MSNNNVNNMKTSFIFGKMQHFAVALTTILLICSCKPHEPNANLSVSDVRYYYIINNTYLLDNSSMKDLTWNLHEYYLSTLARPTTFACPTIPRF